MKIKRYDLHTSGCDCEHWINHNHCDGVEIFENDKGLYIKYDDIKHLLKQSENSDSVALPVCPFYIDGL